MKRIVIEWFSKVKLREWTVGWHNFCHINIERFDYEWFINILLPDLLITNCMIWELCIYLQQELKLIHLCSPQHLVLNLTYGAHSINVYWIKLLNLSGLPFLPQLTNQQKKKWLDRNVVPSGSKCPPVCAS